MNGTASDGDGTVLPAWAAEAGLAYAPLDAIRHLTLGRRDPRPAYEGHWYRTASGVELAYEGGEPQNAHSTSPTPRSSSA